MDQTKEELQKQLTEAEQNRKEADELWILVLNRKPYLHADWHIAKECQAVVERFTDEVNTLEKKLAQYK